MPKFSAIWLSATCSACSVLSLKLNAFTVMTYQYILRVRLFYLLGFGWLRIHFFRDVEWPFGAAGAEDKAGSQ